MSCDCKGGRCGVDHEYMLAACDIKRNVDAYGAPIKIRFNEEEDVKRDRYGSIINRLAQESDSLELSALPLTYSPTDKQKTNAGIRENTDVIAWTPMLDWNNADLSVDDLDTIKADVIIGNKTYEIVDKSLKDQFGQNFLYVVLGLNLK